MSTWRKANTRRPSRSTANTVQRLALVYHSQGKYAEAETLVSKSLEVHRRLLGPEHPSTLVSMNYQAYVYGAEGKYSQAEAHFRQTLQTSQRVLGPENPVTLSLLTDLAAMYQRQGKYALAETYAAQALAWKVPSRPVRPWMMRRVDLSTRIAIMPAPPPRQLSPLHLSCRWPR